MKTAFERIDKLLENRVRLAVMSLLMVNDTVEFNTFKEMLDQTDGNLASHLAKLEKNGYLAVLKKFVGKKPQTSYSATKKGRISFQEHLSALEEILKGNL